MKNLRLEAQQHRAVVHFEVYLCVCNITLKQTDSLLVKASRHLGLIRRDAGFCVRCVHCL